MKKVLKLSKIFPLTISKNFSRKYNGVDYNYEELKGVTIVVSEQFVLPGLGYGLHHTWLYVPY